MEIRLQSCSSLEDVEKSLELAASLGKTGEMEAAAPQSLSPGRTLTFHLEDQGCLSPEESSSLLGNQTQTLPHHPSHLRLLRHRDVLWQITSLSYKQKNTSRSTWPQGQLHESKPIEHAIYKVPEKSGKNKLSSTRAVVCTCLWPVGAGLLLREASACKDLLLRPSCKN